MLRGYSFRPRGWALAAAAAACAAFVLLGNWRARRAEEKRALGQQFDQALRLPPIALAPGTDTASLIHRHVAAPGRLVAAHTEFPAKKLPGGRAAPEGGS